MFAGVLSCVTRTQARSVSSVAGVQPAPVTVGSRPFCQSASVGLDSEFVGHRRPVGLDGRRRVDDARPGPHWPC